MSPRHELSPFSQSQQSHQTDTDELLKHEEVEEGATLGKDGKKKKKYLGRISYKVGENLDFLAKIGKT